MLAVAVIGTALTPAAIVPSPFSSPDFAHGRSVIFPIPTDPVADACRYRPGRAAWHPVGVGVPGHQGGRHRLSADPPCHVASGTGICRPRVKNSVINDLHHLLHLVLTLDRKYP